MAKIKEFLDSHERLKRSVKTFAQAFVGVLATAVFSGQYDISEWKTWGLTVISSALSAGVSAIMNINVKE